MISSSGTVGVRISRCWDVDGVKGYHVALPKAQRPGTRTVPMGRAALLHQRRAFQCAVLEASTVRHATTGSSFGALVTSVDVTAADVLCELRTCDPPTSCRLRE